MTNKSMLFIGLGILIVISAPIIAVEEGDISSRVPFLPPSSTHFYTKKGEVFSLAILGNVRTRRDVDIIKEQLNKFGIKTYSIIKDVSTADHMLSNWKFDISVVEGGNLGDPIFLNRDVLSSGFVSDRYYKNKRIKQLLTRQLTTVNFDKRKRLLSEFQKIYAEEIPSYQIYVSKFVFAFNNKLRLYYTKDGYSIGIPSAYNKMASVN